MNRISGIVLAIIIALPSMAQKKNASYRYPMNQINVPVKVDGSPDDDIWRSIQIATDFFMVLPMDTSKAKGRTDVRMCYDQKHIPVGGGISYDRQELQSRVFKKRLCFW